MKKIFFPLITLLFIQGAMAQKKSVAPMMPDVNKMMKMSPSELEAYKAQMIKQATQQAADIIKDNNINADVSILPGHELKPPVKDIQRLSLIPSRPPTRNELVGQIQQSLQIVQKGIPPVRLEEIKKFTATQKVETIHEAAIASLYNNNPKEAIELMLIAASQSPDTLIIINNLAAMFNMAGVEHKAVPLLQYCLQKLPNSPTILNNLGQSFMGLGDMLKAADYFNKCLSHDSLNIEANHSMGMLHYFKKEYDASMKYFNREMSVAVRRSTMAMAYKMGRKFNLRELTGQRNKRSGRPEKNHFEEITLGKFSMIELPTTAKQILVRQAEYKTFAGSVQSEAMFWLNRMGVVNRQYKPVDGEEHYGLYADLVDAMLEELGEEFTPEYLSNYSDQDANTSKEIVDLNNKLLMKVVCDTVPPGSSPEVQRAFAIKCCEKRQRPIADKLVSELSTHVQPLIRVGQQRWKSYINQLVAIVQLDPTPSRQALVYGAVSGYFNYLSWGCLFFNAGEINNLLPNCVAVYDSTALDSLVEAEHKWKMECPSYFNLEADLGGAAVKIDCNKYTIEAGSSIMGAFEHEFKSGKSTLLLGPGVKNEFLGGLVKFETKDQVFISFDNNKQFADIGLKSTTEIAVSGTPLPIKGIKLGGNLGGVEISHAVGVNSGYKGDVEWKGALAPLFGGK